MKRHTLALLLLFFTASLHSQLIPVDIVSATASSSQPGEEASRAIDGDLSTLWHSPWYDTTFPITLTLRLASTQHVDIVRYTPRTDYSTNGNWREVEFSYATVASSSPTWVTVGTFNLGGNSSAYDFDIPADAPDIAQVRFVIRSGENGFAAAAELNAYTVDRTKEQAFAAYFEDELFTTLKADITSADGIEDEDIRTLVQNLLSDKDSYSKFRIANYEPFRPVASLKEEVKTNSYYNKWENPTGVYVKAGDTFMVVLGSSTQEKVGLRIKNWLTNEDGSTYPLHHGLNVITATTEGNVFVDYFTENYKTAPHAQLHFLNAPVRGYWDQTKMTNEDWHEIITPLTPDSTIVIARSLHSMVAYPVFAWKEHCPDDIDSLMTLYEQVQQTERDMLGFERYGHDAKNGMLMYASKDPNYLMAATGEAAFCNIRAIGNIMVPDSRRFDFWGVGHEWGHNNQMTPGFLWNGCGETTNNVLGSWAQFLHTGKPYSLRLEDEETGIEEWAGMRGGRMQSHIDQAIIKGTPWLLQEGPDYYNESPQSKSVQDVDYEGNNTGHNVTAYIREYDNFVKLVPFYQLNLWGNAAEKCPHIITMVFESIRTTPDYAAINNTSGKLQLNWLRLACDSAKLNLLPFFEKAGMLKPVDTYMSSWHKISQQMVDNLKDYIASKGYPTPTEEINYINGHNYKIYRDRLALSVPEVTGTGCSYSEGWVTVQHSEVQNAVAFETYNANDELIRISMYGLGSNDEHSFTKVLYPASARVSEAAAYIMAVGFDGTRKVIYQASNLVKTLTPNKYYAFVSISVGGALTCGTSTSVNTSGVVTWRLARAARSSSAIDQIWQAQEAENGSFYLYNPQSNHYFTGSHLVETTALASQEDAPGWTITCVNEESSTYTFNMVGSDQYINAYNSTKTGLWNAGASDPNNIWRVEEVEEISLTIPSLGHSLVCYPFSLLLPEGMTAYTVAECWSADWEGKDYTFAIMDEIEGNVLPAKVPAVLAAPQGTYSLQIISEEPTEEVATTTNLLHGTTLKQTGFSSGSALVTVSSANVAGSACSLKSTSVSTVAANKAYMLTSDTEGVKLVYLLPRALSSGMATVMGDGTPVPSVVYDLRGTLVKKMHHGVYILDGKKIVR